MREINRCETIDYVRAKRITAETVDCIRGEELSRLCFVNTQGVSVSVGVLCNRIDIRRNTKSQSVLKRIL